MGLSFLLKILSQYKIKEYEDAIYVAPSIILSIRGTLIVESSKYNLFINHNLIYKSCNRINSEILPLFLVQEWIGL